MGTDLPVPSIDQANDSTGSMRKLSTTVSADWDLNSIGKSNEKLDCEPSRLFATLSVCFIEIVDTAKAQN